MSVSSEHVSSSIVKRHLQANSVPLADQLNSKGVTNGQKQRWVQILCRLEVWKFIKLGDR